MIPLLRLALYTQRLYSTLHYMMICVMILVRVTSSTLDSTVLPAAVRPDVEVLWFFVLLTDPVLCCVQGHRVLIMDSITLVMKEQHLGTRQRKAEE